MVDAFTPDDTAPIGGVTISDGVVAKLAYKAVLDIDGINSLGGGGGGARALAGLRGDRGTPGISIDLHEGSVDIDISMSIDFGTSIPALAELCRKKVTEQVESATGLTVRGVSVYVSDIVFPEEQAGSNA